MAKKEASLQATVTSSKGLAGILAVLALLIAAAGNVPAGVLFLVVAGVFAVS